MFQCSVFPRFLVIRADQPFSLSCFRSDRVLQNCLDWLVNFDGTSTRLGLFYVLKVREM